METAVKSSTRLRHVISTSQFDSLDVLHDLFETTNRIRKLSDAERLSILPNKLLATIFYEPSTRTRLSFETAMYRLGGQVVSTENASVSSSAVKGETIEDTVRTIGTYADAIVLRHPTKGTASKAATASPVPIINAGDGAGEHPTQALLDLYTLVRYLGPLEGKSVALVGDLLYGRTVHSLVKLLGLYKDLHVVLVSPPELSLPPEYLQPNFEVAGDLDSVEGNVDALYVTRVQQERFIDKAAYEKVRSSYVINQATLKVLSPSGIVMHPLPRVGEIAADVDKDSRAIYFEQIRNGVFVRMALLYWLLN